jgi:hypothetical protein
MKSYQTFLTEKKGDTVIFTFGRFNPPTVGHEKLVTAVANVSKLRGGDFFIYPSHTQDSNKNPLNQKEKIKYMKKMFSKFRNNIVASTGKTALEISSELYDKGYKNLIMVVGSDRVQEFQKILDRYNGEDLKHGFYDFDKIEVVSAGERDPDAEGVTGMSASKMRASAVEGDFQSFRSGIPDSLSDKDTMAMFNDIRKAKRLDVIKEGSKWKNIDFKYFPEKTIERLSEEKQITYNGYTTEYLHTSPEAYEVFDEIVNSISGTGSKEQFYIEQSLKVLDEYLEMREEWQKLGKINQKDLYYMEGLSKKYSNFTTKLNFDWIDNSFIYKYNRKIHETLEWGTEHALKVYSNETPNENGDDTVSEKYEVISKWIAKKLKITKEKALLLLKKAQEVGIDPLDIQQKWSILHPSLIALVNEYKPKSENSHE